MRGILLFVFSAIASVALAQSSNTSVNVDAIRTAIGSEMENVSVLFVGDEAVGHLSDKNQQPKGWNRLKAKADVFIVFSEIAQKEVEQIVKKPVVLGSNFQVFFKKTWRDQDYITRVDLKGNEVAFVETVGKQTSTGNKKDFVHGDSDTRLAEYVSGLTDTKNEVSVLFIGSGVTPQGLDTLDLTSAFSVLDQELTHVVTSSAEIAKALSQKTAKPVITVDYIPEEMSFLSKMRWTIVQSNGSDLGRVRGSNFLNSIIKPRSRSDKH